MARDSLVAVCAHPLEVVLLPPSPLLRRARPAEQVIEPRAILRPELVSFLNFRVARQVAELGTKYFHLTASLRYQHRDRFTRLERDSVTAPRHLPVHGERRVRPIGFHDSFQGRNAV